MGIYKNNAHSIYNSSSTFPIPLNQYYTYSTESVVHVQYYTTVQKFAVMKAETFLLPLQLGVEDVEKELSRVVTVPPSEFSALMSSGDYTVIDTRKVHVHVHPSLGDSHFYI